MTQELFDSPEPALPEDDAQALDRLPLAAYAQQAYLSYALSVVKGRALPDVRDGLKPVQRRILFAMHRLDLGAATKPVKSARVVGDVLSKFHPHGDQATYEALVRMAQDFSLRYPLVDGQGNFGSRDGDPAAAMRYTETRLTRLAELLLEEVDSDTVNFQANYDGATDEPQVLPARLPMVLLNGASGIAVGLACELPPHNLREVAAAAVAWIKQPDISLDQLMALLPGPDFAGGAQIISSPQELREAYASGRGRVRVRARWQVEELARGQWQLVFTELPPLASTQTVMEEIETITNPKPKPGKKAPSADQVALKNSFAALLDEVRDESSREAVVRLVVIPKTSRIDREEMVQMLLAHTSLEQSVPINLVVVGADGRPMQKTLLALLSEWGEFRLNTVRRRSQARHARVQARLHVLHGRQLVLLRLEEVIATIRESDEPKPALMTRFALSDEQAEDILEMRLRQLARLEGFKIEREIEQLAQESAQLDEILSKDSVLRRLVIKEIEQDAKKYGDARRTLIEAQSAASVEARVVDEPVTVIVSRLGWVRARQGHGLDRGQLSFKSGDTSYGVFECRSVDALVALSEDGRCYSVPVTQLPGGRGDGQPITTLLELSGAVTSLHYYAGAAQEPLLLASSDGLGFTVLAADLLSRQRAGKAFFTLNEGAHSLALLPLRLPASGSGGVAGATAATGVLADKLAVLSSSARLLVFALDELKALHGGGRGVQLMALEPGETLLAVQPCSDTLLVQGIGRAGVAREQRLDARMLRNLMSVRARRGRALDRDMGFTFKPTGLAG